jgi:signal transduction histidine kinase
MISRLLYGLQAGLKALNLHAKFLIVIALLFVLPLLIIYAYTQIQQVALENIRTTEKQLVSVIHQQLEAVVVDEELFLDRANALIDSYEPLTAASLITTGNGEYTVSASTLDSSAVLQQFILDTTPANGEVFIFDATDGNVREWVANSRTEGSGVVLIQTSYSFARSDAVITDRTVELGGLLLGTYGLLLLIAYWLVRQIDWQRSYDRMEGRLAEQKQLVSMVTHEFRTPLTAIAGHVSFLRESNRLRSRDLDSLDKVEKSTNRLQRLVNDFLEVSRLQLGTFSTSVTIVPVKGVVQQVINDLGAVAAAKEIVLRDQSRSDSISLQTDRHRLLQILYNVVSNAVKYSSEGEVSIAYDETPLAVMIRVQDTGHGISAEDQKKLFQPFSRVGNAEASGEVGSGLGMWITKQLVEHLGGTIGIESIKDVGTHVVLTFDKRKIAQKIREGIL